MDVSSEGRLGRPLRESRREGGGGRFVMRVALLDGKIWKNEGDGCT